MTTLPDATVRRDAAIFRRRDLFDHPERSQADRHALCGDGTPGEDAITWEFVPIIRHLPNTTPEELSEMRSLNPCSPAGIEKEREADRFLAGAEPARDANQRRRTE